MHSDEDGEGGQEGPKDHSWRTADFICILVSQILKIDHTKRPYQQTLWKDCTRKPLLRATNKFKRLEFDRCHWNYDWNRVLWSDETKIDFFGHVHRQHVCRQKRDAYKEKIPHTVKYGDGSLMLWGCFAASGPGALDKINGIMNSKYQAKNQTFCQEAETWL